VVDSNKKMVGLVTIGNLLSKVAKGIADPTDSITKVMFHFNTKRSFKEITTETKLSDLERFFEKNSAAFVTAREGPNNIPVVKKVVTKVDLLQFLFNKKL
jgi:cystathionine beta-synthase